jgi:hypothetical protein
MTSFDFFNIGIKMHMNWSFYSENNFQVNTADPALFLFSQLTEGGMFPHLVDFTSVKVIGY